MNRLSKYLMAVSVVAFAAWAVTAIVLCVQYDAAIGGHIEMAATAEQPIIAADELGLALAGMDLAGLAAKEPGKAFTSIVGPTTPDEDIGFWRRNVEHAYIGLRSLPLDADRVTVATTMIKARDSLVTRREGISAIDPPGISKYPNNTAMHIWVWLSVVLFGVGFVVYTKTDDSW